MFLSLALNADGIPVTETVTVVLFVLVTVPCVSPGGRFPTLNWEAVIDVGNVPLVTVNTTLAPLTACLTVKLVRPVVVAVTTGGLSPVLIPVLTRTGPAL